MNNVSFCGAKVFANPNQFIKNAKPSQIAEAINTGVGLASKELGQKLVFSNGKKMSGALLRQINPDSFSKTTGTLTEAGKKGFNKIYGRQFKVTAESKLKDLMQAAKKIAKQTADADGIISYGFQYMA